MKQKIQLEIKSAIFTLLLCFSGYTDYSAAFYTYDTLLIISTVSLLLMPIGAKQPADNIFRDMIRLIKLPHVIMFIFFLFMLGNCWGFIESYLFLYLRELGAPSYLLGMNSCYPNCFYVLHMLQYKGCIEQPIVIVQKIYLELLVEISILGYSELKKSGFYKIFAFAQPALASKSKPLNLFSPKSHQICILGQLMVP